MAKESGIGAGLIWDNSLGDPLTIGGDVGDMSFDLTKTDLQVPGLADTAQSRVNGLADFQVTANGYFNDANDQWCEVTRTVGSSQVTRTVEFSLSGQTLVNECQMLSVVYTRARDGGMAVNVTAAIADGTTPAWTP